MLDDTIEHPYEPGRQVLRQRSELIAPLLAELADRSGRGLLTQPLQELLRCFSHLHSVRLLRSAPRAHELILLGFLDRHYASKIARAPRPTPPAARTSPPNSWSWEPAEQQWRQGLGLSNPEPDTRLHRPNRGP